METPNTSVEIANENGPLAGTWFLHDDDKSKMGPQKKPSPTKGKTVKKIRPTISGLSGQMSPKPILFFPFVVRRRKRKLHAFEMSGRPFFSKYISPSDHNLSSPSVCRHVPLSAGVLT